MQEVNCYFPITLRITGRPSDAQLDQLSEALARALTERISFAERTIAEHYGETLTGDSELVREAYAPTRADEEGGVYNVPSYDGQGRSVSLRLRTRGRSWHIRTAINFHARLGAFLDFIDDLTPDEPLPDKILYIDQYAELHWVSLWLVQVNQRFTLEDLNTELTTRARQLSHVRANQLLAVGLGTTEGLRRQLIELDEDHRVARDIPSLLPHNARRVTGTTSRDTEVLAGGWALFASMVLPRIELVNFATLEPEARVTLRLSELAFLVPPIPFERQFRISWQDYVAEWGDELVVLRLLPVTIQRRIHMLALDYLVQQRVNQQLNDERDAQEGALSRYGWLYVLNESALGQFPTAARASVEALTNDMTRRVDDALASAELEPGWKVVFAFATLDVNVESISAARYRPEARRLTPLLLARLRGDASESRWKFRMLDFLQGEFGARPPETRPDGGIPFEYVLAELERRQSLHLLFDQIEHSDFFPLQHLLLLLSLATVYAGHERVRRLHERMTAHMLANLHHTFLLAEGALRLEHDARRTLRIGGVLGEVDSIYIFEKESKRLKAARLPAFREALETESRALIERMLRGTETRQFSEEEFSREALGLAVQRINLTEDDFEEITIQRSLRLVRLEARMEAALPIHYVTFEFVERVESEAWRSVSQHITETDDEFTARLIYWRLARAGEVYEKIGLAISVVGLVVVAWEAGIIAALVTAAGGTTTVLISIGISELIFILRVVFGDARLTLRGFLEAALDGYLMALGFRGAGFLGRAAARAIGTESLKRLVGGWVAERLIVGTVGGAGTAALTTFSHDLINIATGRGGWSSIDEYVQRMTWGALLGTVFEFGVGALQPILRAGGENALETLAQVAERVRAEGFTNVRWTALTTEALGNLRAKLSVLIGDMAAQGFARALGERLTQVAEQLGGQYRLAVFRRVLELSPSAMSRPAVEGLEKFLNLPRADLTNEAALALLNRLSPAQMRSFLEALNTLDSPLIGALSRAGQFDALAAAPQIANAIRQDPVLSRLILSAAETTSGGSAARIGQLVSLARRLPEVPESIARGDFFARGGTSQVYEVAGRPDLLLKQGGGRLPAESQGLVELELMGIDTVYAATRRVEGQTNIVVRRVEGVGSKDIIGRLSAPLRTPQHTEIITQRTINDLERIYRVLQDRQANIGDFQFIVRRADGAVFVNDPVSVNFGRGPSGNVSSIIDRFRRILRESTAGGGG